MIELDIIRQENPGYLTLLLRKSFRIRIAETVIFIILIIILGVNYNYQETNFKILAVISAFLTIGLSPVIYKIIVKPKFILTNTELVIQKFSKQIKIPLVKIQHLYDLKYFYSIEGKKTPLAVSDAFLETLDEQLAIVKKSK